MVNDMYKFLCNNINAIRTPDEWCQLLGIIIYDPDGWDRNSSTAYEIPIDLKTFMVKSMASTLKC